MQFCSVNDNGLTFEVHLYNISSCLQASLSGLLCVFHNSSRAFAFDVISETINKTECHA